MATAMMLTMVMTTMLTANDGHDHDDNDDADQDDSRGGNNYDYDDNDGATAPHVSRSREVGCHCRGHPLSLAVTKGRSAKGCWLGTDLCPHTFHRLTSLNKLAPKLQSPFSRSVLAPGFFGGLVP